MLADPEHVEPHLVGEFDLLDQVLQPFGRADGAAGLGTGPDVCKGIEAEIHDSPGFSMFLT